MSKNTSELLDNGDSESHTKKKTKRMRTTFTEEQIQVLQANFQIDSNPDGQDLERIAQITGLSKRVTQVKVNIYQPNGWISLNESPFCILCRSGFKTAGRARKSTSTRARGHRQAATPAAAAATPAVS